MKYIVGICVLGIVVAFGAFVIRGLVRTIKQYKDIRAEKRLRNQSNNGEGLREPDDPVEIIQKEDSES